MTVPQTVMQWLDIASLYKTDFIRVPLILAMIWQESEGEQYAWNPEPRYQWFWNVKNNAPFRKVTYAEIHNEIPPLDFPCLKGDPDNEWWAQQASWGLMQIMGAVARERGFKGPWIPEVCKPDLNIFYGVKHLWVYCYSSGRRSTEQALLRYNGGGNENYPDEVLSKQNEIERSL